MQENDLKNVDFGAKLGAKREKLREFGVGLRGHSKSATGGGEELEFWTDFGKSFSRATGGGDGGASENVFALEGKQVTLLLYSEESDTNLLC